MLILSSIIYACITAFLTFFVLRLLSIPRWPAMLAAVTSPYWFGTVAQVLGQVRWTWIVGLGLLIPYVVGPVLVRALSRWPVSAEFEPWSVRDEPMSPRIRNFFDDVACSLATEGYLHEIWLVQRGFVQHTTSRMQLFVNASEQAAAIAYAIESDDPKAKQFVSYIDFVSYRRDGRHRITNNAPRPSPYPPIWYRELEVFPQVRDPARLARLHRALTSQDGPPAPLPDEIRQEPLGYAAEVVRRELEHQVATGYLAVEDFGDHLRPTLRGAAMMTWKMLPPASWFIAWRLGRRADALVAALDYAGRDERPLALPANQAAGSPALLPLTSVAAVLAVVAIFRLPELFGGVRLLAQDTRQESFALPADFVAEGDFGAAVRQLESLAHARSDTLFGSTVLAGGARSPTGGFVIPMRPSLAGPFLEVVRPMFLPRGFYVIRAEQNFGVAGVPDQIAILPTADPLEVVRRLGTRAAPGRPTADVVEWLRALNAEYPLTLTGASADWIAARLVSPPADPLALARRVQAFCPNVIEHGAGTVEALAKDMARRGEIYCWW